MQQPQRVIRLSSQVPHRFINSIHRINPYHACSPTLYMSHHRHLCVNTPDINPKAMSKSKTMLSSANSRHNQVQTTANTKMRLVDDWVQAGDEKTGYYWWNRMTDSTTHVGAVQPDNWYEVLDEASNQLYYMNQRTRETTAIGEARPGASGRVTVNDQQPHMQAEPLSDALKRSLGMGLGIGLVFGIFGMMF